MTHLMLERTPIDCQHHQGATVNFDDVIQPLEDEKFELYIGDETEILDDLTPTESGQKDDDDDQSGIYLQLMLQELKQSLKQHERFVAARQKLEEPEDDDIKCSRIESPARFQVIKRFNSEKMTVPPPPPLEAVDFDEGTSRCDMRCMLETIKAISTQRQFNEDVFGDSGDESTISTQS